MYAVASTSPHVALPKGIVEKGIRCLFPTTSVIKREKKGKKKKNTHTRTAGVRLIPGDGSDGRTILNNRKGKEGQNQKDPYCGNI